MRDDELRSSLEAAFNPAPASREWAAKIAALLGCSIRDLEAHGNVRRTPFVLVFIAAQHGRLVPAPDVPIVHALASIVRRLLERGRPAEWAAAVALRAVGMPAEDARIEPASTLTCRLVLTPWP